MTYTPVELRHVRVGRSLLGYNRAMVEQMIEEVAESFEVTWRERGELADKVEALEKQVADLRRREDLLTNTLVAAEQAASVVREQANRAAETILAEAQQEARATLRAAQAQRELLFIESRRIEGMLRAALIMVEQGADPVEVAVASPAPAAPRQPEPAPVQPQPEAREDDPWPVEDTGEFRPVSLPPAPETGEAEPSSARTPFLRRLAGGGSRDFDWGE